METDFGISVLKPGEHLDRAEAGDFDVALVGTMIVAIIVKGDRERPAPSLKVILKNRPPKRHVTVDMGAVKFVTNGADVMGPGIVEADETLVPGDLVWIRDQKNGQPLAIGEALVAASQMVKRPGKAIRSLHFVGDDLWTYEG